MLVITKGEAGGAQTHLIELCTALQGTVHFTAVIGGDAPQSFLGNALQGLGVRVITLPSLRNSLSPIQVITSVRALLAHIQSDQPHIIHAHSAVAGVIARLAGKLAQRPVVYTVHGFGFKPQARPLIRYNAWLAEALLAAWTTRMICVSQHEKQLGLRLPMDPERASVLHNAIADVPWQSNLWQTQVRIVMVARMAAPKRHDLLLQALVLLAAQDLRAPTLLLGSGPDQPALKAQAKQLNLGHVVFAGDVNNVAEQLAQHQIFVLLSDHEGLPMSILEAMRAGMAIVATRLEGITEMLEDQDNALLVNNHADDIAQAIHILLQNTLLRQRLGQAARQSYQDRFTPESMSRQVLDIYQEAPLLSTASWPMTLPRSHGPQLSSHHAQRQQRHLGWSLLGLCMVGLAYLISQTLESTGLATHDFSRTVLACIIPYALAAQLIYGGAHMPVAERTGMLMITTGLPFLLTPLGFALLQQPYSRGAVLLTCGLSLLWFWWGDHWRLLQSRLKLVYFDDAVPQRMATLLRQPLENHAQLQLVPWPRHWVDHPQRSPAHLDVQGALIDSAAVPTDTRQAPARQRILTELKLRHIRLYNPVTVAEAITGQVPTDTLKNELWQPDGNPAYDLFKRTVDFSLVLLLIPLWLTLGLLVALAVKTDSPGPALFSQIRTGLHGRPFRIYKFRSMRHNTQSPTQFAQANDPRITRLGHWLRRTRLDEIPQLWNVLLGHMSLIGPRPEQEKFVHQFAEQIPSYPYRHLVRPGLTGWAQVQQGYASSADETVIKLSYDLYYVTHYSLAMDLLIALKTIQTVITGRGAR